MTIIKINRDSIKKNPRAGQDTFHIPMPWQITFETNLSTFRLPDWLKENVTEITDTGCSGWLDRIDDRIMEYAQSVVKDGNRFEIKSKRNIQTVHSMHPDPEYMYEYENTPVECENCHKMIPVLGIMLDEDFDGNRFESCPKCNDVNTFEYEYENINEIMK